MRVKTPRRCRASGRRADPSFAALLTGPRGQSQRFVGRQEIAMDAFIQAREDAL
jgi:hypothetical protein